MYPFYFGESDRRLYGVYHPPTSDVIEGKGIVLCYPLALDYMRSHRAFRQLAGRLNKKGMHCFRFDYYGSGDSAGESGTGDMNQWRSDVDVALTEFKELAGISELSVVGLRFGALIAATALLQRHQVENLVLWDPVVDAASYIDRQKELHHCMLRDPNSFPFVRTQIDQKEKIDLVGFEYSKKLIREIEEQNFQLYQQLSVKNVFLYVSEKRDEYELLGQHLQSLGILREYRTVEDDGDWENLHASDKTVVPDKLIRGIVDALDKYES